jgi:hypothetical protein
LNRSRQFLWLFFLQTAACLVLDCEFKAYRGWHGSFYTCFANNLQTSFDDRIVTDIKGAHEANKTNDDVKQLMIKKQYCPYLPLQLATFFKNMEVYYVMNSNVRHLMTGDLDGLDKLEIFDVSHNPVEQLGGDFFKGHTSIHTISFYDCHLKSIDPKALDPLVNLEDAYMSMNVCIDMDGTTPIRQVKAEIADKCQVHIDSPKIFEPLPTEKVVCPKIQTLAITQEKSLPFIKRHSYFIISFLCILSAILGFVALRNSNPTFNKYWSDLTVNLIQSEL